MPKIAYERKKFEPATLDAIGAWLDVGQEFAAKGVDINEGGWSQLVYAIRKWGEELVQLRIGDPSHTEQALREAREAYEGQYERGTYPEAIDRG